MRYNERPLIIKMKQKKQIIIGFCIVIAMFFIANFALAQDFGINEVNETINLATDDPRTIAGRIINIALSFLGLIILLLIVYAGFLWMTSNGEEEKVRKAKGILKNAIIGLVITLSAWAIATFIISRLWGATTGGGGGFNPTGTNNFSGNSGLGAIGSCSVRSVYPENNQKDVPRNSSIIMSFKEPVGLSSACIDEANNSCACDNGTCTLVNPEVIRIYTSDLGDACGDACPEVNTNMTDVSVAVSSDEKTLVLSPHDYLGSQNEKTNYIVKVTSDLEKANGSSMFRSCSTDILQWTFEVSTKLDLTPPQVVSSRLFPQPDSEADILDESSLATNASAEIFVKDCPNIYKEAQLVSVSPETEVDLNYQGNINRFKVLVPADSEDKAQLFNGNTDALLGISDFDEQNVVTFPNYFSLKAEDRQSGDLWQIEIIPEQKADSLTVGNVSYIFSSSSENNRILVNEENCTTEEQAINIQTKLSGHPDINVDLASNRVLLTAKIAGTAGNSIRLETSNNNALELMQFSGGEDKVINYQILDKKDTAMNTVIKIGFNEAMNPVTLSGSASDVASYVRVVNADPSALANNSSCSIDSECRSYNCEASYCVGDYLNGRFMISDGYKTLEFISDKECGINGCGEKVYCLPPNSNLSVEIEAADLSSCDNDQNCAAYNPYKNCSLGALSYRTCQDNNQRNYPLADIFNLTGSTDLAFNSLDGNRDTVADGPISFFNDNNGNTDNKDSYKYSFFVNDQKEISAPEITSISPLNNESEILNLTNPVEIIFNTLMMSSTLDSGSTLLNDGQNNQEHKLINLKSASESPLGYWVVSSDQDSNPLDGVVDITITEVRHSPFTEAFSYSSQVGSGVKDVYQNCFKPSTGPDCQADWENPSCCFGTPTQSLNEDGNCE